MYPFLTVNVRSFERAFLFREGELLRLLAPGRYRLWNPKRNLRVDVLSARDAWILHADLDLAVKSGVLDDLAVVLNLAGNERALVWLDGRLDAVLDAGRYALWTGFREVRVERVDARQVRFEHPDLSTVLAADRDGQLLERLVVPQGQVGLVYLEGALAETLGPGQYAFWKGVAGLKLYTIDQREAVLDVAGQEIMTRDKVSLRMNALVTFRVADAARAVSTAEDHRQALYREAQLALRAAVGGRLLDDLLTDKDAVTAEVATFIHERAASFGLEVLGFGIRDIVLPGDMKNLLNKVINRSTEGSRGFTHHTPGRNGGHAQPGQHRPVAREQPDLDASARAGGDRKDRRRQQVERHRRRQGHRRSIAEPSVGVWRPGPRVRPGRQAREYAQVCLRAVGIPNSTAS